MNLINKLIAHCAYIEPANGKNNMQALFYRVSGFMSGSRLIFSLGSSDLGSQTLQIIIK